jgi:uncharacterized protein (DUF2252 family)
MMEDGPSVAIWLKMFHPLHPSTQKILAFNEGRLPKMTAIKYDLMRQNVFRFFRGCCHLFYEDLANSGNFPGGPVAWISGDPHLENFGSFRADNDQVYFDLNDFDEAILAPVTWEIVRLACSVFLGFQSLSIPSVKAEKMVRLLLKSYGDTLAAGRADFVEETTAKGIICDFLERVSQRKRKRILRKRTTFGKKKMQLLLDNPKHGKLNRKVKDELCAHVQSWLKVDENSPYNYTVRDVLFRLAGTGSVGLERYVFLLKTSNQTGPKYMLLDMKEAARSSLSRCVSWQQPQWTNEAERVVTLQKRMQNRCPALLSFTEYRGKSFVMQEMQSTKDNINFTLLKDRYRDMYSVVDKMAILTASAHIRSAGQDGSCVTDELKAFGRRNDWQDGVFSYAQAYAEKMKEYYKQFSEDAPFHI